MRKSTCLMAILVVSLTAITNAQESLPIGPGDQLDIEVFDTPEMSQHPRVTDAGMVPLLFVGDVSVVNMTPAAAARAIEDALLSKHYMLHPQVTVTVEQYATTQVSVMGQVVNPGQFAITTPTPLLSILALAGGLTDLADRHITVERRGDATKKVNYFLSNRSDKALDDDVVVNPGDTVLVPKAGVIYVLGDVGKPGGFSMTNNDSQITVLQALALAGAANRTSVLSKAKLIRQNPSGTQDVAINVADMQKGKRPDIFMLPDDILFIPFSFMKNLAVNGSQIAASATTAVIYHP